MQTKTPDQDTEEDCNTVEGGLMVVQNTPTPQNGSRDINQSHQDSARKGKTLTVLFKPDKQGADNRNTNLSSRQDQHGLIRVESKDDQIGTARYDKTSIERKKEPR